MKVFQNSESWKELKNPTHQLRLEMSHKVRTLPIAPGAILEDTKFRLGRHKDSGQVTILDGTDDTNRCLLFASDTSSYRGSVSVLEEETTAKILVTCSDGTALGEDIEVVALLSEGEMLVFKSTGRSGTQYTRHLWNGTELETDTFTTTQWERRNDETRSEETVEDWLGCFKLFSLRGDFVSEGIRAETKDEKGEKFLQVRRDDKLIAHLLGFNLPEQSRDLEAMKAKVGRDQYGELVFIPIPEGEEVSTEQAIVLVNEYSPGSGSKRFPSFSIDWDNDAQMVTKLASAYRSKGSGSDEWTLVIAPADWAENIAYQFINERDEPSQTISYQLTEDQADAVGSGSAEEDGPITEDALAALLAKFGK